ncbi:MAG: DUF6503 family protein [Saprospiraceae bacterium]|nr:DUF6503 family protein [Saprospiraceae bacterium]
MRIYFALSFLAIFLCTSIHAQSLVPTEIINKSIEYHDPKGKLFKKNVTLHLTETRPNGKDRKSKIHFHIKKERFQMDQHIDDQRILSTYNRGNVEFTVDGDKSISDETKEKFRLTEQRVTMLKNYYQYLWLLPMKLKDAGTNLNPTVKTVDFFGKESLEIRVTYDPSVGGDVWYFYFHPSTYGLQGYRFYHEEEKNDGEYILLEGETEFNDVRLPKERKWYTHKEDKFLGADILDELEF